MKLSACLITKNEEEYLDQCLASFADHVDEIIIVDSGSTDNTKKIAAKYGARIFDFKWVDDFSAARNFAVSKATGDWWFWVDADNTVANPHKLKQIIEQVPTDVDVVNLMYNYEIDEDGVVRTKHWRERLFRNDGCVVWKGRLHETPVETRKTGHVRNEECWIDHHAKPDRWGKSLERNIRILEKQAEDEGDNPDARTMFYLASAYNSAGRKDEALDLYYLYVRYSGWDEERAQAWHAIAGIHNERGEGTQAMNAYLQGIKEAPNVALCYIGIAKLYLKEQKFERALHWLEMALAKPESKSNTVQNPLTYTWEPLMLYAEASMQIGKFQQAINAVKKAQAFRNDDYTKEQLALYEKLQNHKDTSEAVARIGKFLVDSGEDHKLDPLLEAVPDVLNDNPLIVALRKKATPPKVWPKKSVVIFTGNGVLGEWGPWSLAEGIGGSEEAIIRLSKRLTEQGYSVSVFANPGPQSGLYDGVEWRNYWELDGRDTFDVFVSWRSPWTFDNPINARKKYLWLHDVMPVGEFTPKRLANLDKVIVLSKYHRSLFPNIPDDKIFLSANGIDAEDFDIEDIERDPHLVVYQSSHVRGLHHIYDIWPEVKKAVPKARLRVMYGWDSYKAVHKDNPERMAWMEKMIKRAEELDGVEDIGKVSQRQIVEELLSAGVWAYPCPFPEISCITGMKAQAGGAVPVASNYAALDETIQWGSKMDMDEWDDKTLETYKKNLIDMLKNPEKQEKIRKEMIPGARKTFSWTAVAKQWIKEFK